MPGAESRVGGRAFGHTLLFIVITALVFVVGLRLMDDAEERDRLWLGDEVVELALTQDRIAVILKPGEDTADFFEQLPPGLDFDASLADGIHLIDPDGDADRDELVDHAELIASLDPESIAAVGVAVTPEGAEKPLLMTKELIIGFLEDATEEEIQDLMHGYELEAVRQSRFAPSVHLFAVSADSDEDPLEVCKDLTDEPIVDFAEPNLVHEVDYHSHDPNDPFFANQWHHENTGQADGTPDADIDTPQAWDITRGSSDVVVAILEDGFDESHPDLVPNLWDDPLQPGQHGWDFADGDASLLGNPADPGSTAHGTAVAGCVGAKGDNELGVVGSAPECRLMLIRLSSPTSYFDDAEALHFAWANGADVITNSWSYPQGHPIPTVVRRAIEDAASKGRDGKGCLVLFSVRNEETDVTGDLASLPQVMAVGSISNQDTRTLTSGYGPCMSVLGPSRLNQAPNYTQGTLNVATTDWCGDVTGYNADPRLAVDMDPGWPPCGELSDGDYTACFGGTSAATPIVAGVAALLVDVDDTLTGEELRRLLQDTTDHAEDSVAAYSDVDGRSTNKKKTHGYGRVNAFEAVRVAAPVADGGRGGVDVFVRDNRLDWGNTEQPSTLLFESKRGVIGQWRSPDVKVDAPPFGTAPSDAAEFEAAPDEAPAAGATNRVYVRVRNRGPRPAQGITVSLLHAPGGTAAPALPSGYAALSGPAPAGAWQHAGTQEIATLPSSGASLAGTPDDAAGIVAFDVDLPAVDPAPSHVSLLVVVDDPGDGDDGADDGLADASRSGTVAGIIVATDNNAALRNAALAPADGAPVFFVRNPCDTAVDATLQLVAPPGVVVTLEAATSGNTLPFASTLLQDTAADPTKPVDVEGPPFSLPVGAEIAVRLVVTGGAGSGTIELRQWRVTPQERTLLGGLDFPAAPAP